MEEDCEREPHYHNGLAMTVEQREMEEASQYRDKLVQKMESWLRAHFDGKSAGIDDGSVEELLFQVGYDWLVNRGLRANGNVLKGAVEEALSRYRSNWEGKVQGEDNRSRNFGRNLGANMKEYGV